MIIVHLETNMSEKKPFSSRIQGIDQGVLTTQLCREFYGDLEVQPECEWVVSDVVQRSTIQTHPFCDSLGLDEEQKSEVIHAAPRNKQQQLRKAIFSWSRSNGSEATLEKLLEALYMIGDEVELVEDICQSECSFSIVMLQLFAILYNLELLLNKISDDRRTDPQTVWSESSQPIKNETVPHKVSRFENLSS